MGVNKVIYNNTTLIDLTGDTVTADTLAEGVVAHDKRGEQIVGTFKGVDVSAEVADYTEKLETQDDILNQIRDTLSARFAVPTTLQNKTVTPTTAEQTITADSGFDALGTVTVEAIPSDYLIPELQSKVVTPSTSVQMVTPDSGFDGLSDVTVNAIPQSYTDSVYQNGYNDGYNAVPVFPKVDAIHTLGSSDSSTYHGDCYGAVDSNGNLILSVIGGTSTAYESIYFTTSSVPNGVSLVNQSYYSYASMSASAAYVAIFSGITESITVSLNFGTLNSSNDYVECGVEIVNTASIPDTLSYTVEDISGASYGFKLNSSGYYESQNKGVSSSYAICRVRLSIPISTAVYFDCINYAESNYDYGLLGNTNTELALSNSADSSVAKSFKGSSSSNVQTVSYSMSSGVHFVDVKFIKDGSQNDNNDSLQFKVRFA